MLKSWTNTLPQSLQTAEHLDVVSAIFEWLVDPCLTFVKKSCKVWENSWIGVLFCFLLLLAGDGFYLDRRFWTAVCQFPIRKCTRTCYMMVGIRLCYITSYAVIRDCCLLGTFKRKMWKEHIFGECQWWTLSEVYKCVDLLTYWLTDWLTYFIAYSNLACFQSTSTYYRVLHIVCSINLRLT